jgi:ankyrin repeat protein
MNTQTTVNTLRNFLKLQEACRNDHYHLLEELRKSDFNFSIEGNALLKTAIRYKSRHVVEYLLDKNYININPNINTDWSLIYPRTMGGSPLFIALLAGDKHIIELLLKRGARTESIPDDEWLILAERGKLPGKSVKKLLDSYWKVHNN